MKKIVMFYLTYKGKNKQGHRISTKIYSIFTRKSKIVNDLYDWQLEQQELITKDTEQEIYVSNLKIIGL